MEKKVMDNYRGIKSFVLRRGRMTKAQSAALEQYGEKYLIPFEKISQDGYRVVGPRSSTESRIIVEIGFGNGEALAMMAEKNSSDIYIGIEVYPPGVGNLLKLAGEKKLENIRIINHDAVEVMDLFSSRGNNSWQLAVDGFHVFFPDPWQKKKHNKRRIINPGFTMKMAELLVPGGYIYAVTDWEDYAHNMQEVFRSCPLLYSPYSGFVLSGDSNVPWRPQTSFERKGLGKNHRVFESFFIKKPAVS